MTVFTRIPALTCIGDDLQILNHWSSWTLSALSFEKMGGIRHLQPYYAWRVLQVVLHVIDEQSSRHQFHQRWASKGR